MFKYVKKIFNKLFKKNTFELNLSWDVSTKDWTTSLTLDKEESFESSLPNINEEAQSEFLLNNILYYNYKLFTRYEEFKEYLIEQKIINPSLKIYSDTKHKRLSNLLS